MLELDETVEAGPAREIREETGIEAEPVALTGVYKNMKVGVVALIFRCRQVGGTEAVSEETTEVRWILPSEIEALMAPTMAVRLLDALSDDVRPQIRMHDGVQLIDWSPARDGRPVGLRGPIVELWRWPREQHESERSASSQDAEI